MNRAIYLLILIGLIAGCSESKQYDDERFVKFLDSELSYSTENLIVIILQNEECICTVENMGLAMEVFKSSRYKDFKKLLIVKSKNHKILQAKNLKEDNIEIFINDKSVLEHYGLYFSIDRIFIYGKDEMNTYDLHIESTEELRKELV